MNHELQISLEDRNGITIFDIQGDVTAFSEPLFKESYQQVRPKETQNIILKFYETAYINSGGIAVLIQLLADTRRNGQKVSITGLSPHFQKIFNMVGITKLARIYDSVEDAMADMTG